LAIPWAIREIQDGVKEWCRSRCGTQVLSIGQICSPVNGNGDSRRIAEKLLVRLKTNKN
jgi:hypothetical protein